MLPSRPLNLEKLTRWILPNPRPGRFFSDSEMETIRAVADAMLEDAPVRVSAEEAANNVDTFLLSGGSQRAWRVRALFVLVEMMPLSLGRPRFSKLPRRERRELMLTRFAQGRYLWSLCGKCRHLVNLGAYADPKSWETVGYIPVLERKRYRKIAV